MPPSEESGERDPGAEDRVLDRGDPTLIRDEGQDHGSQVRHPQRKTLRKTMANKRDHFAVVVRHWVVVHVVDSSEVDGFTAAGRLGDDQLDLLALQRSEPLRLRNQRASRSVICGPPRYAQ